MEKDKYVKLDDALKMVMDFGEECYSYCEKKYSDKAHDDCVFHRIATLPAADVRENVRGEWEKGWNTEADPDFVFPAWQCSLCGSFTDEDIEREPLFKFCPNCGADMRGGEKDG